MEVDLILSDSDIETPPYTENKVEQYDACNVMK